MKREAVKTWGNEVENKLTIRTERVKELERFCTKFGIGELRSLGDPLSYGEAVDELLLKRNYVHGSIGKYAVKLSASRSKNVPFISLEAQLELAERELQICNQRAGSDVSKPETEFSDESHQIASAIAEVLGMEKVVVGFGGEIKMSEALIVRDDKDSIVVAYNKLYPRDC